MKTNRIVIFLLIGLSFFTMVACSGGGGSGSITGQNGSVSVGLTDATSDDYQAVYITVKEVKVSMAVENEDDYGDEDVWTVVAEPNATYNLLELVNGVIEPLGLSELEAGQYNQMRLVLGVESDGTDNIKGESHPFANYIVYGDDSDYYELFIPSGFQSGFKIVGGFTIEPDQQTDIVLDFNVLKSIVQAGASGKWLLKPTVKAMVQDVSASITGMVFYLDGEKKVPVEGAMVSAQLSGDTESTEIVTAATVTDETGEYQLLVDAGTYTVAASIDGYQTAAQEAVVETGGTVNDIDFQLIPAEGMGTIFGSVTILNGDDDQSVTINILKKLNTENGNTVTTQVATASVANGGTYWFDLPEGTYSMVAIFNVNGEEMTLEANESFEIINGTVIEFDILFENVDDDDSDDGASHKVTVCHKGREITISASALQAHLNHGDREGSCDVDDDDSDDADDGSDTGDATDDPADDDSDDPVDDAADDSGDENEDRKVTICHKGREITVSESALDAHLKHGDTIGECPSDAPVDDDADEPPAEENPEETE